MNGLIHLQINGIINELINGLLIDELLESSGNFRRQSPVGGSRSVLAWP
jgi:hypothetical protein